MTRLRLAILGAVLLGAAACHREVEMTPLVDRKIYLTDKFYDVQALSPEKAVIVGYGGKILTTSDGGRTWNASQTETDRAIYNVAMVDETTGWAVGQGGTVLKTSDGGKTWKKVDAGTDAYLFAMTVVSPEHMIAVGDKSTIVQTRDGGATWQVTKYEAPKSEDASDEALAGLDDAALIAQEPSLYAVKFVDGKTGWIVGEFGKILKTSDGGATWTEQQQSLVGGEIVDALDLPSFFGIDCIDANECAAVGLDGKIAATKDGGATWAFQDTGTDFTEPLFTVQLFPDGSGWAAGVAGEVLRRERGEWQSADLGMRVFSWLRQVSFADANHGWLVGGFGLILRTKDGGKTWIPAAA
ncbi:MAG: YCF48-related protein [Thermodesulfobacteriota bacterium]